MILNIFSSPNTLTNKSSKVKAGVKGDANLLRPTLMCAVPLILERIYKSIVDTMRRQGWAVEELFHYFVSYKMKWQVRFKLIGKLDMKINRIFIHITTYSYVNIFRIADLILHY